MSRRFRRVALTMCAALVFALLVPATAMAATRYTSRIYGLKSSYTVDNSNPATTAAPAAATGKLQRYYGGRWVNISGTVKLYRATSSGWAYVSSKYVKAGSNFSFGLTKRGRYMVKFAGTTTTKPTYKITKRVDKIVSAFPTSTVVVTDLGDGTSSVKITQVVTWNEAAYPGQMAIMLVGVGFADPLDDTGENLTLLMPSRSIKASGTYEMTFVVNNAELYSEMLQLGMLAFDDPYVVGPSYGDSL